MLCCIVAKYLKVLRKWRVSVHKFKLHRHKITPNVKMTSEFPITKMGKQMSSDFVVDTVGFCFICLEKISPKLIKADLKPRSSSIYSMQYLSRYLKLKMRNVFQQENLIPADLLAKVENSILKVNLCEECASWNAKLSDLYRQLEKIEVEAASYLQLIRDKLADKPSSAEIFDKLVSSTSGSGLVGKLEIAETLRNETMQKCSRKLHTALPKVKIPKLTRNDILLYKNVKKSNLLRRSSDLRTMQKSSELKYEDLDLPELKSEQRSDFDAPSGVSDNSYLGELAEQNEAYVPEYHPTTESNSVTGPLVRETSSTRRKFVIVTNPKTGKVKCTLCPKEFASPESFRAHYQSAHLKVRYKCELCNKVFTTKQNLVVHQQGVHLKQQFNCQYCSKSFSTFGNLSRHVKLKNCPKRCRSRKSKSMEQNHFPCRSNSEENVNVEAQSEVKNELTD